MTEIENEDFEELGYEEVRKIIKNREEKRDHRIFLKEKKKIYIFGVLCAFLILTLFYFVLPVSSVNAISVSGNSYLETDYIKEIAEISLDDKFYLSFPSLIKNRIMKNDLIEDCTVTMKTDHTIAISVVEKPILGYVYLDDPFYVLKDGTLVEMNSTNVTAISRVPLITGFKTDEDIENLVKAFEDVNQSVIEQMAEINRYSLSYDSHAMRVLMRSGVYFVGTYYSIYKVNYYNLIYARMSDKSLCIFGTEDSSVAFSAVCPWNEENLEYWTDSDGNTIMNSAGEKAVKHYYLNVDTIGNQLTDANGNPILIPIDEYGDEVYDTEFEEHYEEGYYATGTLIIPETVEEN